MHALEHPADAADRARAHVHSLSARLVSDETIMQYQHSALSTQCSPRVRRTLGRITTSTAHSPAKCPTRDIPQHSPHEHTIARRSRGWIAGPDAPRDRQAGCHSGPPHMPGGGSFCTERVIITLHAYNTSAGWVALHARRQMGTRTRDPHLPPKSDPEDAQKTIPKFKRAGGGYFSISSLAPSPATR
ncbi:hypothetical protein SCP_0408220 [Sparassis crispa]|uniref:Uncharacterized protein n=1 Tax=Sparassis crispa TaxID=139825 RepID=A0A401GJT9_9APHY|nr:hypothetical protein SCP_0408220 [Sparassis crispa]GBE82438.1 hypothetical protein SCP_0408220 [Sparassis crispa]